MYCEWSGLSMNALFSQCSEKAIGASINAINNKFGEYPSTQGTGIIILYYCKEHLQRFEDYYGTPAISIETGEIIGEKWLMVSIEGILYHYGRSDLVKEYSEGGMS